VVRRSDLRATADDATSTRAFAAIHERIPAWSHWSSVDNTMRPERMSDQSAAMAPAAFRALLKRFVVDMRPTAVIDYDGGRMNCGALLEALERHRPEAAAHGRRVAALAGAVATPLGLDEMESAPLRLGALLHDVGKLAVPAGILAKPGPLTDGELAVVRRHAAIGATLLRLAGAPPEVAALARHHHERLDGSGYPDGMVAPEISAALRILVVCDVYDALLSDRPYSPPWPPRSALAFLSAHPALYDPACVRLLEEVVTRRRRRHTPHPGEEAARRAGRLRKHEGSGHGARSVCVPHGLLGTAGGG
jgi:putative nucleotidyltransferase with HDIG domain